MAFAPARIAVRRLRASAFRNYEAVELILDGRPVCLFGPNGSGKTNLLEAVSFLGPGRGLRGAGPEAAQNRAFNPSIQPWAVYAEADTPSGPIALATGAEPGAPSRRRARLEGAPASQSDLAKTLPMVWLTPKEDRLWAGPRAERLKFFDRLVLSGAPDHGRAASVYEKAMRRRQRLLDEAQEGAAADPAWLDALEAEMTQAGAAMAINRAAALERLQSAVDARGESAFPRADLALSGALEEAVAAGADPETVRADFAARLAAGRGRDGAAGRALTGPHRTDLLARHREKGEPAQDGSTGEQKALVLNLVLAQADALARTGAAPLLLLDEACAHLDAARRAGLAAAILEIGAQAWLTGVDAGLFAPFGAAAQTFAVEAGRAKHAQEQP